MCDTAEPMDISHVVRCAVGSCRNDDSGGGGGGGGGVLRGVVHVAGVSSDVTIRRMSTRRMADVLAPKAGAAWALHAAMATLSASIDGLLLLSSVTGALGNTGQANYALANGALDCLARASRGVGRPTCSLQPLPVAGVGLGSHATVARLEADLGGPFSLTSDQFVAWLRAGLDGCACAGVTAASDLAVPGAALQTLGRMAARPALVEARQYPDALASSSPPTTHDGVAAAAAMLPHAALLPALQEEISQLVDPSRELGGGGGGGGGGVTPLDTPLTALGIDSLGAMELRARIEARFGVRLRNVDVLAEPTAASLHARIAEELGRVQQVQQVQQVRVSAVQEGEGLASRPWAASTVARGLAAPPPRLDHPIIFLLSSPRSGSSLLQLCLNAHPALYAGQELFLLPFETLGERDACLRGTGFADGLVKTIMELRACSRDEAGAFLDGLGGGCPVWRVYQHLAELAHPRVLVDKTPPNAESLAFLRRAREMFGGRATYLHLVRHPYACISSGVQLARDTLGGHGATWQALEAHWVETNAAVADFLAQVAGEAPARTLTYELLVTDPPAATRLVCEALGVPWEAAMVNPYDTDAVRSFEPASRVAVTDPKLLRRRALEARHAETWREVLLPQPLGVAAKALALSLGYELLPELPDGLEWLTRSHAAAGAPPIVCIHDFTGGVGAFRALAPLLHAPCLGIGCTARVLRGAPSHHELASRYLRMLPSNLWPDGTPARLVAYSLGCRTAHRMASALEAAGRSVRLVLLDGPIGGGGSVGHAPRLAQLAASPFEALPEPLQRALRAAGGDARQIAAELLALADTDPEGASFITPCDGTRVLYVAASSGENVRNGTMQNALRTRPHATCHQVDGTHFDFMQRSANELAQLINDFLLGAAALGV